MAKAREELKARNKDIIDRQKEQEVLRKERHMSDLRITELQHDIKKQEKNAKDMDAKASHDKLFLLKKYHKRNKQQLFIYRDSIEKYKTCWSETTCSS